VTCGSSQPRIETCDSSQPRIETRDSSQPRIETCGSSQPRIVTYGSSQPRIEHRGQIPLVVQGKTTVHAEPWRIVYAINSDVKVEGGGTLVLLPSIDSAQAWCDSYGVPVNDGVAILFKSVGDRFKSPRGGDYTPGTTPTAIDWDGGGDECGGGFHFSPRPSAALTFNTEGTKFVACPVAIVDMRAPKPTDSYPRKIKARGCCAPVWECNIDGEAVSTEVQTIQRGDVHRTPAGG
jgi:hypothetical protein